MATFSEHRGDIFSSEAQSIVVTVNTVGIMGAGIALEARLRWPRVFEDYVRECESGVIRAGRPTLHSAGRFDVILFPTKIDWKHPSSLRLVEQGLEGLVRLTGKRELQSVAMPHLGCSHGGLSWSEVKPMIIAIMSQVEGLHVELWEFIPDFVDPFFLEFRHKFLSMTPSAIAEWTGLSKRTISIVEKRLSSENFENFIQFRSARGIGIGTAEKIYRAAFTESQPALQQSLFVDEEP